MGSVVFKMHDKMGVRVYRLYSLPDDPQHLPLASQEPKEPP